MTDIDPNNVACAICGYTLTGLADDATCPECGAPVERARRLDQLNSSHPAALCCMAGGVALLTLSLVTVAWMQVDSRLWLWDVRLPFGVELHVPAMLFLMGVWLATWPEPGLQPMESPRVVRRVARWSLILAITVDAAIANLLYSKTVTWHWFWVACQAWAYLPALVAVLLHLRCVLARSKAPRLTLQFGLLVWLMPTLLLLRMLAPTDALRTMPTQLAWSVLVAPVLLFAVFVGGYAAKVLLNAARAARGG